MISKNDIVLRLSKLKFYHLIAYLYEVSNNRHAVVLRPNLSHPKYNERLQQDFACYAYELAGSLWCDTVKPNKKTFRLSERK